MRRMGHPQRILHRSKNPNLPILPPKRLKSLKTLLLLALLPTRKTYLSIVETGGESVNTKKFLGAKFGRGPRAISPPCLCVAVHFVYFKADVLPVNGRGGGRCGHVGSCLFGQVCGFAKSACRR
jgi:hypothetical protein